MARDISEWLEQLGLGEYAEAFAKNRIKFDHLADLSEDDLRELGVAASKSSIRMSNHRALFPSPTLILYARMK